MPLAAEAPVDHQAHTQAQATTKTKEQWQPPWWLVPTYSAALAVLLPVLLSSLAGIGAFLLTGAVRLGQVGVGGFVLALLFALLCAAVAFILGVRACLSALVTTIGALFIVLARTSPRRARMTAASAADVVRSVPTTDMVRNMPPAMPPPSRGTRLRERVLLGAGRVLWWLIMPRGVERRLRRYWQDSAPPPTQP